MARRFAKGSDVQKKWMGRINRAKKLREKWASEFRVQMGRDYFEGRQNPGWPAHEWITVNKIYSHMQARLPNLYKVDPFFYVKLAKSYQPDAEAIVRYEETGRVRGAYLNYLKKERGLKDQARLGILDAHFAYGVLKTHYYAEEEEHEMAGNLILDEDGEPMHGDDGEPMLYPETRPVNERYCWSRVHPDDLLWDADAWELEDKWNWIAERVLLTEEQVQNDRRHSKRAIKGANKTSAAAFLQKLKENDSGGFSTYSGSSDDDDDREIYVAWEIYDLEARQWLRIIEDAEEPIIEPQELPAGIEKHPYSILRFTLRDRSPYPIPPVSQALDPQRELNVSRSRLLRHRKRFNRKYEVAVTQLEDPDLELPKLEVGDDGAIIRSMTGNAVRPISDAPLDQQTYQELSLLNNDLVEALGQPDTARGIATADSATEAALIDRSMGLREGDALSLVADWVTTAARKMDQLVQAHITRDEAVLITGPRGAMWEMIRASDYEQIAGEFSYEVNVGATQPQIPSIQRAQFLAMLGLLAQAPEFAQSPALLRRWAEMNGIDDAALLEELAKVGQMRAQALAGPSGGKAGQQASGPLAALMGSAMGASGGFQGGGGSETSGL